MQVGVQDFAHDALHEFLHLDGKIFQTLKLLMLKPGQLTGEYLEGRRARYVSPVRLYLTASLIYFALVAISPSNSNLRITAKDVPNEQMHEVMQRAEDVNRHVQELVAHYAPRAMFVLMPFFGLLTWTLYRGSQPYYVPHLYYAIHFHAFAFLVFAAAKALQLAGTPDIGGLLLVLAVVPYHYIALRRVFGGSRAQVAWKGTVIAVTYALTIGAIFGAIVWIELRPLLKDVRSNAS